jgi:hypothetical protein
MDLKFLLTIIISILGVIIPSFITFYIYKMKIKKKKIVVIDDDLSIDKNFINLFSTHFNRYKIIYFYNVEFAKKYIKKEKNINLCLIDIIIRSGSELSGVSIAEHCLNNDIKVLIFTGYTKEHLHIQIQELEKLGLSWDNVFRKPATILGYNNFFEKVESLLK